MRDVEHSMVKKNLQSNHKQSPRVNININGTNRNSQSDLNSNKYNSISELHHSINSARGLNSSRISNRSGSNIRNNKVKLNLDPNDFNGD